MMADKITMTPNPTIRRSSARLSGFAVVLSLLCLGTISCGDSAGPATAGPAAKLAFTIQPQNTLAGKEMAPFAVAVEDLDGNIVTTGDYTISVGINPGPGWTDVQGPIYYKTLNGVATISGLRVYGSGPDNTFTAYADYSELAVATSKSFEVTSGPPAKLSIFVPMAVNAMEPITPAVEVTVVDAAGNRVWGATDRVTVALGANPAGGTLTGTKTITAANGVASFSNLVIDKTGANYTLAASAPNISGATSGPLEARKPLTFISVSAGQLHSCGVATDGQTYCWGRTPASPWSYGYDQTLTATLVPGGIPLVSVSSHVANCGLTGAGEPYCWPTEDPQTGTYFANPTLVPGAPDFAVISVYDHNCGVTSGGDAYCWGVASVSDLGDGMTMRSAVPVAVTGGVKFTTISAGLRLTCAVATTGVGYCWGRNNTAPIGDATDSYSATPAVIMKGVSFTKIAVGEEHACGISTAGDAYCWGHACVDCFGTGSAGSGGMVVGGLKFSSISVGKWYTCAVTTTGVGYCWGYNINGELGDGTSGNSRSVPTRVAGNLTFTSIDAGDAHTCGIAAGGAAYCWGYNYNGQLGDGTQLSSKVPVRVR
jgi:alpha-tubulin suppressor-like RCC1 family protein